MSKDLMQLRQNKEALQSKLSEMKTALDQGMLTEHQYFDKKFEVLDGRFEDEVMQSFDREIQRLEDRKKAINRSMILGAFLVIALPLLHFSGMTGFITLDTGGNYATLSINESFDTNTTKDYTFLNATSVMVSGKIYGYGETWIYLVHDGQRRLVHYSDTSQQAPTGMVVAGTPVNNSNTTPVNITNIQANQSNSTTNSTSPANATNSTNITGNTTVNNSTNMTNSSNLTTNSTNSTNSTSNSTTNNTANSSQFSPEIATDSDTYDIGDNVSIEVLPENSSYTLYLHAPDDTYILHEMWWIAQIGGDHRMSAFVTYGNETERASKEFYVRGPLDQQTSTFTNTCVETCDMSGTPVTLEIIVDGTRMELDSMTYKATPASMNATVNMSNSTNTSNATNTSAEPVVKQVIKSPVQKQFNPRSCLAKNPNARPAECFTPEVEEEFFPNKTYSLVNVQGSKMAEFAPKGDLRIRGQVIENSSGSPQQYDLHIKGADAYIDVITGDLHLRGQVRENQDTLMWSTRKDYVVSNEAGIYLGIFDAGTGDLLIRGTIQEGGLQ